MVYYCTKCNEALYRMSDILEDVDSEDEYYDDNGEKRCIDNEDCEIYYFVSDESQYVYYCTNCHFEFTFCCEKPMILQEVCRISKSGYVTINAKHITYHKGDLPAELDSHINVEIFEIDKIGDDDSVFGGTTDIWPCGPDGGFGMTMICRECGKLCHLNDK